MYYLNFLNQVADSNCRLLTISRHYTPVLVLSACVASSSPVMSCNTESGALCDVLIQVTGLASLTVRQPKLNPPKAPKLPKRPQMPDMYGSTPRNIEPDVRSAEHFGSAECIITML